MITYCYPSPVVEFYDDEFIVDSSEEESIDLSFIIEEDDYIQHLIQGDEL